MIGGRRYFYEKHKGAIALMITVVAIVIAVVALVVFFKFLFK